MKIGVKTGCDVPTGLQLPPVMASIYMTTQHIPSCGRCHLCLHVDTVANHAAGTMVRRIDSTGSSIFGAPSETALESLHLGSWPGGSAAQSPAKPAMFPPSPARPPVAASSYTLRPQEPEIHRAEAPDRQAAAQAANTSATAGIHNRQPADDIFDEILR